MARVISEFFAEDGKGKAIVFFSAREELFYVEYFDDVGHKFFTEEFPNKALNFVEDAAENWALGIRNLV